MRFSTPVLLVSLAASVAAAPTSPATLSVLDKRNNLCRESTFENASSGGSPLVSDCQRLFDSLVPNETFWVDGTHRTFKAWGTCLFGARSLSGTITTIGNEDARDLIRDSIAKFQWQGKVGAGGVVICGSNVQVRWGVYHS